MNVSDSQRASSATMLIVAGLAASVGMTMLTHLVSWLVPGSYEGTWPIIVELLWLGATGVLVLGIVQLSGAVDAKALLQAVAGLLIVNAVVDLGFTALGHNTGGSFKQFVNIGYDASILLSLVARGLLLFAIMQLTMKTHAWVVPLLGTVAVLILMRSVLGVASIHRLFPVEVYSSPVYRYGLPAVSMFNGLALLVGGLALKAAVTGGPNVTTPALVAAAGLQPAPAEPVNPIADFLVGGILLAVGIGVTVVSMAAASDGGRYVVATGAIAVGVVRIVRGFVRMARSGG